MGVEGGRGVAPKQINKWKKQKNKTIFDKRHIFLRVYLHKGFVKYLFFSYHFFFCSPMYNIRQGEKENKQMNDKKRKNI